MSSYCFGDCTIHTDTRSLRVGGGVVDVQPLVFDLLAYFVRHPDRVIARNELLHAVWRSPAVSDSVVARAVMKARRAIGDDARAPRMIVTAARSGYRFDCRVTSELAEQRAARAGPDRAARAIVPRPHARAAAETLGSCDAALAQLQFERAADLEGQGRYREALELLQPCLPRLQPGAAVQLLHARLLLQCGRLDEAQALLRSALAGADAAPGTPLRIELLLACATCLTQQGHTAEACTLCEQALRLAEVDPQALHLVPALLQVQARALQRRGELHAAMLAAQRAVSLAAAHDDPVTETRARLRLASVLVFNERVEQAADAAVLAADRARHCGLLSLEAEAVRMHAALKMSRRDSAQAERLARHAAELCAAIGDRTGQVSARVLRCVAMIESERVDEAAEVLLELDDGGDLPAKSRPSIEIARAALDWKRGHRGESIARLERLVEHCGGSNSLATNCAAFELLMQRLDAGHVEPARVLLERVRTDRMQARGVAAGAALALAVGQRAQAVELLLAHWQAQPGNSSSTDMDIRIDLAWLLLEDEAPPAANPLLDSLAASLLDYGPDLLSARIFRAAYLLRRAPSAESRGRWEQLVAGAQPLRRPGCTLGAPGYAQALVAGAPPRLPQLLSRACF